MHSIALEVPVSGGTREIVFEFVMEMSFSVLKFSD